MPVPRYITSVMDSLKSAELIQELKVETEKLIESNSMVANSDVDCIVQLEPGFSYEKKPHHLTPLRRNVIPYPVHNYGQQPPLTPPEPASPDPNEQTDTGNEDEDEEGVTRCICGFDHDDGYMICCDGCSSWQHIDCMGIKSDSVPETYHCDRCKPRQLDVERARAIQQKKKDTLTDDDGDDDTDTDDESGQTYTAVSQTPTRITLTANSVIKKKTKNRIKSASSVAKTKKRKKVNRKRPRPSTGQINDSILQIDTNSVESQFGSENFQEIAENIYDQSVTSLGLQDTENLTETIPVDTKKIFSLTEVADNRKGLTASEDVTNGQFIIEFKGKVLLSSTYEESNPFFKRSCPFILHYNKIDQLELVVDARQVGNEARYLRRSCCPNAEVAHAVKDGCIRLLVFSRQLIATGAEITIPFEFPIETYPGFVECACKDPLCVISKHNQQYLPTSGRKRSRYSVTDPNSSTRNSASENQGETDSDDNEVDGNRCVSRRKKLSREERKLQAYLKQIEKMEKKQKKGVKDPKVTPRSGMPPDASNPQGVAPLRSFETGALHSPPSCIPRRIAPCTPVPTKKRLSVSKKRPRISSCSSDPLSPEVFANSVSAQGNVTTVQEHLATVQHTPEHNGLLKPKSRRDRENLSLSVAIDKIAPSLKDPSRRQKRDYIETVAGSPTPPSTPGQLSPPVPQANSTLSVDTSSNLASPSGHCLSVQDKRSVLNGLLQIAGHSDGGFVFAGSPRDSVTTSNGMVTAEEVMGEMMTRENATLTPTGKSPTKRSTGDCKYFGSLKKRWLVQYDRYTVTEMRSRNGISPVSLSSFINDFSIQKKAEHIASYVFKTPKNYIPLKKRRLREVMLQSADGKSEKDVVTGSSDGTVETGKEREGYLPVSDSEKDSLTSETHSHTLLSISQSNTPQGELLGNETLDSSKIEENVEFKSEEISASEKSHILDCETVLDNREVSRIEVTADVNVVNSSPSKEETLVNACDNSISKALEANERSEVSNCASIYNSVENSEKADSRLMSEISLEPHLTSSSNVEIRPDLTKDSKVHKADALGTFPTTAVLLNDASDKSEEIRTLVSKSEINSFVNVSTSDTMSNTENSVIESEQIIRSSHLCVVPTELQVKPSSILRDPRLSSSSSRSSWDSIDGHSFIRSDSVSSVEDSTPIRLNSERKQPSEKEFTPNTKKKMSLREYQNRKKAKPTSVVHNSATNSNENVTSKNLSNYKSDLLADTDSLLTPRTLSLSNSFAPLPGRDSTLVTTNIGLLPPGVTIQEISQPQQQTIEVSSNGPMFEPVSPSEEYPSLGSSKERASGRSGVEKNNEFPLLASKVVETDYILSNEDSLSGKEVGKTYSYLSPKHIGRQVPNSSYPVQQDRSMGKTHDNRLPVHRKPHNFNPQFHG